MVPRKVLPAQDKQTGYNLSGTRANVVAHHRMFPSKYREWEYEILCTRLVELETAIHVDYEMFLFDPVDELYTDLDSWLQRWGSIDMDYVAPRPGLDNIARQLFVDEHNFEGHGEESITADEENEIVATVGALRDLLHGNARSPLRTQLPHSPRSAMDLDENDNSFVYSSPESSVSN